MPAIDRTRHLYCVDFDGAEIELLAAGDDARHALEGALDIATVALAAEMVGGMQRVTEIAVEYCKTRKQFGKPIGQFQAVQHQCADMLLLTESSRSAAYYAAWALQEGAPDARTAVSVAKAYASDAYREVGNRAIQVHGGMGFTWENDLHLYYRRAKASEIAFGDADVPSRAHCADGDRCVGAQASSFVQQHVRRDGHAHVAALAVGEVHLSHGRSWSRPAAGATAPPVGLR